MNLGGAKATFSEFRKGNKSIIQTQSVVYERDIYSEDIFSRSEYAHTWPPAALNVCMGMCVCVSVCEQESRKPDRIVAAIITTPT